MKNNLSLKNHFLIAMPALKDINFHQSVTYIYEHNDDGALGIMVNKPMRITLGDVLKQLEISTTNPNVEKYPIVLGGPVAQQQGFIIHRAKQFAAVPFVENEEIAISTSKEVLQSIAQGEDKDIIVSLGYAGWSPGQLESEMADNSWMVAPADPKILFETPFEKRWRTAAALIGVDLDLLSSDVGHA